MLPSGAGLLLLRLRAQASSLLLLLLLLQRATGPSLRVGSRRRPRLRLLGSLRRELVVVHVDSRPARSATGDTRTHAVRHVVCKPTQVYGKKVCPISICARKTSHIHQP